MKRAMVLIMLVIYMVGIIPQPVMATENDFNYVDAFAKSILSMRQTGVDRMQGTTELWRGPCHIHDGEDVGLDLTGGFHDCGDHVKFGLPQCTSASNWAYYEFEDTFIEKGQDEYMLNILKFLRLF